MAESLLRQKSSEFEAGAPLATQSEPGSTLTVKIDSLEYRVSLDVLEHIFRQYGQVKKIVMFSLNEGKSLRAYIQYTDEKSAIYAREKTDGQNVYTGCCRLEVFQSKVADMWFRASDDQTYDGTPIDTNEELRESAKVESKEETLQLVREPRVETTESEFSKILFVTQLDREKMTPDDLFNLFGVYGDVHRVKIMYDKRNMALVQMATPQQAMQAMTHLNGIRIWNRNMQIKISKHSSIKLPREEHFSNELTRDYEHSPFHKFKDPEEAKYNPICLPSDTLQLSNIPTGMRGVQVREEFGKKGFESIGFQFFWTFREIALIKFKSKEEATLALMKMQNHELSQSNHLRISFAALRI